MTYKKIKNQTISFLPYEVLDPKMVLYVARIFRERKRDVINNISKFYHYEI